MLLKLKSPSQPKPKLLLKRPLKSPEKSTSPVKNAVVVVAVEEAVVNIEVDAVTTARDVVDTTTVPPKPMTMVSWLLMTVQPLDNAVVANVVEDVEATTTAEVPKKAMAVTSEEEGTEEAVEVVANTPRPDLLPQTTNEEATGTTN